MFPQGCHGWGTSGQQWCKTQLAGWCAYTFNYVSLCILKDFVEVELLKHGTEVEPKEDTIHQCRAPAKVTAETVHVDLMAPLLTFCNSSLQLFFGNAFLQWHRPWKQLQERRWRKRPYWMQQIEEAKPPCLNDHDDHDDHGRFQLLKSNEISKAQDLQRSMEASHRNSPCSNPEKWPQATARGCSNTYRAGQTMRLGWLVSDLQVTGHDRSDKQHPSCVDTNGDADNPGQGFALMTQPMRKQHSLSTFVCSNEVVSGSAFHTDDATIQQMPKVLEWLEKWIAATKKHIQGIRKAFIWLPGCQQKRESDAKTEVHWNSSSV